MSVGFTFKDSSGYTSDIENYLVRREYFSKGGLWTWGDNNFGQLGDNTITDKSSPGSIIGGLANTNWNQVSTGYDHIAAIKTDGTLWTWGRNNCGQLGDNTLVNKSFPIQTIAGGNTWNQVSVGLAHTAAIKNDGTLWSWGRNEYGQLGINITSASVGKGNSSPVQIFGGGNTWNQVFCLSFSTAAIKTDGTLWSWGNNSSGELGIGIIGNGNSSPVQISGGGTNWKQVSYSTAIKTDGTLWSWGYNAQGQLGDNTTVNKSTPVQISGGGTNWKQVISNGSSVAAIKTDGTLWTWGYGYQGQLGIGSTANTSTPVQVSGGGTNWKQVTCGDYFMGAIKTDGTLWSWGYNNYGQLGLNTISSYSSPVPTIDGFNNWKYIDSGTRLTAGIVDDSL